MARQEKINTPIGLRLRTLRGELSRDDFSKLVGVHKNTLGNYERGDRLPEFDFLEKLKAATGVNLDWVISGDGDQKSIDSEFTLVPRLDVSASAGDGAENQLEHTVEMLAFRRDWLRQMGISTKTAHVLTARGDSMDPTIRDGDTLLVDTGIDTVVDEGIYVLLLYGQLFVKRLERQIGGAVVLRSDNPSIRDRIVSHAELPELTVAGRVVWFGRSI